MYAFTKYSGIDYVGPFDASIVGFAAAAASAVANICYSRIHKHIALHKQQSECVFNTHRFSPFFFFLFLLKQKKNIK